MSSLAEIPLTQLKGVGNKLAETLTKLDIHSLQDLLFHLPNRYEDRTRIVPLSQFRAGMAGMFEGQVRFHKVVFGRRRSLEVHLEDQSGSVTMRFFHFNAAQVRQLEEGQWLRCFGEARLGRNGLEFYHPEYRTVDAGEKGEVPDRLTPIYPLTEGIQQPRLRKLCEQALDWLSRQKVDELLPTSIREDLQLPELNHAVRFLHAPPKEADQQLLLEGQHPCQHRLIFEELLAHHLSLLKLRHAIQKHPATPCPASQAAQEHRAQFLAQLPFKLTGAQQQTLEEISADISQPFPMLRLVQGDVGSGKTVIAALSALQAVAANVQVALMAPTEILAEQHFQSFSRWFEQTDFRVGWLSGKTKGKVRQQTLEQIENGHYQIIVGTHALFQNDVTFKRLGLAIIDEQHRFGVHQRLALKDKGKHSGMVPHQLIMTATPIPRTLAMSAYADLDTSVIDELPPGRQAIDTFVIPDSRRNDMLAKVNQVCEQGEQAYWVCTLIEDSEALQCQAAEDTARWLSEQLPERQIGLVHGRMSAADKSKVMDAFVGGVLDLLVATTVIEVGVDVPDATLMVIENPERLGLAQLHQLRGRVGRGDKKSYCALMYHPPLSQNGKARLQVMRDSQDGFVIAEKDLELRGPGEVLGTRQTGLVNFRIADLQRDRHFLDAVKRLAPHVENPEPLIQRWIGQAQKYANV